MVKKEIYIGNETSGFVWENEEECRYYEELLDGAWGMESEHMRLNGRIGYVDIYLYDPFRKENPENERYFFVSINMFEDLTHNQMEELFFVRYDEDYEIFEIYKKEGTRYLHTDCAREGEREVLMENPTGWAPDYQCVMECDKEIVCEALKDKTKEGDMTVMAQTAIRFFLEHDDLYGAVTKG